MKDLGKRHALRPVIRHRRSLTCWRSAAWPGARRIPGDRRVKNLILTDEGCELKQRLEAELTARMPWSRALTDAERVQLLALIRKMLSATQPAGRARSGDDPGRLAARP